MAVFAPNDVLAALRWRYACKQFDPVRKIPPETWSALEQALVLAPSSYGLQPWKFFVVDQPAIRAELLPHSWGQRQIVDASHLVVLAVKLDVGPADAERLIDATAATRGVSLTSLEGFKKMVVGSLTRTPGPERDIWMSRQVFIALGVLLTAAAMLGVDACPMEGFVPEKYDEILGLPAQGYASRVVAALGYRAVSDAHAGLAKVRYPVSELVEHI